MTEGASNLGLTAENIPVTQENILAALRSGIPLICSMYPGDFTYTGHFIVLTGIDENGAITVNDPNSPANTKKHWSMSRNITTDPSKLGIPYLNIRYPFLLYK
ncbi:MAG: C39 family peptidase [Lachnospiraceae bacterium]